MATRDRTVKSPFHFENVYEYEDPITGDGKVRIGKHYRVYERSSGLYLGTIGCMPGGSQSWESIVPNPHYDPTEGPGFRGGEYIGRGINPQVLRKRGRSRSEIAEALLAHSREFPQYRPIEARPSCERRDRELVDA